MTKDYRASDIIFGMTRQNLYSHIYSPQLACHGTTRNTVNNLKFMPPNLLTGY